MRSYTEHVPTLNTKKTNKQTKKGEGGVSEHVTVITVAAHTGPMSISVHGNLTITQFLTAKIISEFTLQFSHCKRLVLLTTHVVMTDQPECD